MGEIAEMMLDGTLCEGCGVYLEGEGDGIPRYCSAECARNRGVVTDDDANVTDTLHTRERTIPCGICNRKFASEMARYDHRRDKHGER